MALCFYRALFEENLSLESLYLIEYSTKICVVLKYRLHLMPQNHNIDITLGSLPPKLSLVGGAPCVPGCRGGGSCAADLLARPHARPLPPLADIFTNGTLS